MKIYLLISSMKYFTEDYNKFFKDLAKNNNKEWFHSQKKRYEESVKNPLAVFVNDLIKEVQKLGKSVKVEAKDCISRINRDIRFSKDKTPYDLHFNAFVSSGGKKDKSTPGLYVRLSPEMVGIMGGSYAPEKVHLEAIRKMLAKNGKEFRSLINARSFKSKFGDIKGEQMKRVPKEFQAAAEKEPLILNKQFYYVGEEKPSLIASPDLMKTIMFFYKAMKPVNNYITKAIK